MPEEPRRSKRRRLLPGEDGVIDGPPPSLNDLKHDEEFWLEDGNIILISSSTAFRIYRGLLAAQSSVFADMFTASSSKPDESYEGCPVIHLSESPEDLRHFLRVLLPKSQRIFVRDGAQTEVSFDQVFAVVRLSHKYQVDDILQQAMTHLKRHYTTRPLTEPMPFTRTHGIGAVNLAILTETPMILPRALLDCASLGSAVLDGWTREDGSVEHLSASHLRTVMDARDRLIIESFYGLKEIVSGYPGIRCAGRELCKSAMLELLLRGMDAANGAFEPQALFESWKDLLEGDGNPRLCSACVQDFCKNEEDVLADIWSRLPSLFRLNMQGWPIHM